MTDEAVSQKSIAKMIEWIFELRSDVGIVQYGILREYYFKRFYPRGIFVSGKSEPRQIPKSLYDMAFRQTDKHIISVTANE
jgi:hypothetical protein